MPDAEVFPLTESGGSENKVVAFFRNATTFSPDTPYSTTQLTRPTGTATGIGGFICCLLDLCGGCPHRLSFPVAPDKLVDDL